jgi:hypothetical protein
MATILNAAQSVLPLADGSFMVLNDEGVPLGRWILGDDFIWLFDEDIPLAFLPRSGESVNLMWYVMLAFLNLVGIGLVFVYPAAITKVKQVIRIRPRK